MPGEDTETQERKWTGEDTDREGSDAATSQRTPGAGRSWERQRAVSQEPSEGAQSCQHLDFGLLASRTLR